MAESPLCELEQTRQRIEAKKANLSGSTFTGVNLAGAAFNDVKLTEQPSSTPAWEKAA
jgi:uncharacterized protein YjbI with pentapeptide repeats